MKKLNVSALACFVLSAVFLPAAFGNHRTGSLPLPEILVAAASTLYSSSLDDPLFFVSFVPSW